MGSSEAVALQPRQEKTKNEMEKRYKNTEQKGKSKRKLEKINDDSTK